jgi:hypothetical protein
LISREDLLSLILISRETFSFHQHAQVHQHSAPRSQQSCPTAPPPTISVPRTDLLKRNLLRMILNNRKPLSVYHRPLVNQHFASNLPPSQSPTLPLSLLSALPPSPPSPVSYPDTNLQIRHDPPCHLAALSVNARVSIIHRPYARMSMIHRS